MFYGSGSGVVTILNAADVADIATAEQTITWNRYNAVSVYHWGKYTISTTTSYRNELEEISGSESIRNLPTAEVGYMTYYAYFFNSYTINTSNGTITLTGRVEAYENNYGHIQDANNCYIDSLENTHMARDTVTSNQVIKIASYSVLNSRGRSDGTYKVASTTTRVVARMLAMLHQKPTLHIQIMVYLEATGMFVLIQHTVKELILIRSHRVLKLHIQPMDIKMDTGTFS